jgi:hypothetical protein
MTVEGDETSEELVGTAGDDGIMGYAGDDDLYGEEGNDVLIGTDSTVFGAGEIDYLTGGAGEDIFVLGTTEQAFYIEEGADDWCKPCTLLKSQIISVKSDHTKLVKNNNIFHLCSVIN